MSDLETAAIRNAVRIAFRQIDGLTEQEREQVLTALVVVSSQQEGEIAQQALFHLQQQRKAQLTLRAIVEGVGAQTLAPKIEVSVLPPPRSAPVPIGFWARLRRWLGGAS